MKETSLNHVPIFYQDWAGFLNGVNTIKPPNYIAKAKSVSDMTKNSLAKLENIPLTNIGSVEQLFNLARKKINTVWTPLATSSIFKDAKTNIKKIKGNKDTRLLAEMVENESKLARVMEKNLYFRLEKFKYILPDIWKEILLLASVKEQQKLNLVSKWVNELPESAFENFGLSKKELILALDIQQEVQPLIDYAYIKQIDKDENSFPPELTKISEILRLYSKNIIDGNFPDTYKLLPDYLVKIADAYSSRSADDEELRKMWGDIDKETLRLIDSGCPMTINCHNKNKKEYDELDFSVQLRTPEVSSLQKMSEPFYQKAKEISSNSSPEIPPVAVGFNVGHSGINLFYQSMGEARNNITNIFTDRLHRDKNGVVKKASFITTLDHELGHQMNKSEAEEADFSEFKADLSGIYLFKKVTEEGVASISVGEYILDLAQDYLDEIVTSTGNEDLSSDKYSLLGQFFISFFKKNNMISPNNGSIIVHKEVMPKFFDLAKLGEKILLLNSNGQINVSNMRSFLSKNIFNHIDEVMIVQFLQT